MNSSNFRIGKYYENYAKVYLEEKGLVFIDQNYHSIYGEIDLIMKEHSTIIFFEIKYRKNNNYGGAEEQLSLKKFNKLLLTAHDWGNKFNVDIENTNYRFDYLCFLKNQNNIHWIKNITDR